MHLERTDLSESRSTLKVQSKPRYGFKVKDAEERVQQIAIRNNRKPRLITGGLLCARGHIQFSQQRNLRRATPTKPVRPVPSNRNVEGSGTGEYAPTISSVYGTVACPVPPI